MENDKQNKRSRRPGRNASQVGVVRVSSNPAPDAEDRLRRVFAILVKYATRNGLGASDKREDASTAESRAKEEH